MRLFIPIFISIRLAGLASEPQQYTFTTGEHIITMAVRLSDPYIGRRLAFRDDTDSRKEICLVGNGEAGTCPNRFVGTVATVRFVIKRVSGKLRAKTSLREHVTVVAQSPELPPRPPFERSQLVVNGAINDLQAFGYDETDITEGERETERRRAKERLWRLCRQEL